MSDETDTYSAGFDREYNTTFAHHNCREDGRVTIAIDDSNDKLRCVECGRFCEISTGTNHGGGEPA